MAASSRGSRSLWGAVTASPSICSRCATTSSRFSTRPYSSLATATSETPAASEPPVAHVQNPPNPYAVHSGIILTRPPLVTRELHPFENAFFFYQKRLEERLNAKFVTEVYFKPDTARILDWNVKVKEREGNVARELGHYKGKNADAWNDELKVGDGLSGPDNLLKNVLKDAEARYSDDAELIPAEEVVAVPPPMGRVTEADKKGDVQRLDRQVDKTLYLVVKGKDGWAFPADKISWNENLHETAKRVMDQSAGVNMNTWIVGRVPVAHVVVQPKLGGDGSVEKRGVKTFFLKGRIMAGQADLKNNPLGYTDFKWLTREELEKEFSPEYFRGVRNMMADR